MVAAGLLAAGLCLASGCGGKEQAPFAEQLDALTTETPVEAARDAFNQYDPDLRRRGLSRLARADFGDRPAYVRLYRLLLTDPDPTVRAAAIKALGVHGEPDDAIRIAAYLNPEEPVFVRWQAARSLQRLHAPVVARDLIAAVREDGDEDVRHDAAIALAQYRQPAVVDALIGALDDREYSVAQAARRSLRTLTGQEFEADGPKWMSWADANRGRLFQDARPYRWRPYPDPPSLIDRLEFWRGDDPPSPKKPRGWDQGSDLPSARTGPTETESTPADRARR